jgi:hypothetical protein
MIRWGKVVLALGLCAVMMGAGAADSSVGQVAQTKGMVLLNKGENYTTAWQGGSLSAGDRLMALDGGQATLTFADDCVYELEGNRIFAVTAQSPCAQSANLAKNKPRVTAASGLDPRLRKLGAGGADAQPLRLAAIGDKCKTGLNLDVDGKCCKAENTDKDGRCCGEGKKRDENSGLCVAMLAAGAGVTTGSILIAGTGAIVGFGILFSNNDGGNGPPISSP